MVPFSFGGQDWLAMPQGALFWPARNALLVADLHLEKGSWFARHGQMLPPYDSAATIAALEAAINATNAQTLICLGDSFHDGDGPDRLDAESRLALGRLAAGRHWLWVTGNHDPIAEAGLGTWLPGEIVTEARIDGITLRHEADPRESAPEISGHFHPKVRVAARGRRVSRRCFVLGATKIILPAFGALTGGLDAGHAEIRRAVGDGATALVPLDNRLLRFPIAA